jgi:hypothetical protein
MTLNKRGAYFWNIQITDKSLLFKLRKIIGSNHKISVRNRKGNYKTTYRLQIGSKEMFEDLLRLGMKQGKTKSLVVPNVPWKFFSDFVRGYFDGDGNVWVGNVHKDRKKQLRVIRTVFTSSSSDFLKVLRDKLRHKKIENGVLIKGRGNYYRLTYSIQNALKLFNFMYNPLTLKNTLFLKRKKAVFEKYIRLRS